MKRNKKRILLDEETIQRLLDECYNETNDINIELTNLYVTWNSKIGDLNEIAVLGKEVLKALDQKDKLIEKKLRVAQQIQNILNEKTKEANRMKLLSAASDLENPMNDGSLPKSIDEKINAMIEHARKMNK